MDDAAADARQHLAQALDVDQALGGVDAGAAQQRIGKRWKFNGASAESELLCSGAAGAASDHITRCVVAPHDFELTCRLHWNSQVDPLEWALYPLGMEPVQFSDAVRLTELSSSQLREWCGKRALFQPAVPARGPGRLALFSWQDLIALRVFREITLVFGGKATSWALGIKDFRHRLDGQFFPSLWGKSAVFSDQHTAALSTSSGVPLSSAVLIVPLDPHLSKIMDGAPSNEAQGQLPLVTRVGPR